MGAMLVLAWPVMADVGIQDLSITNVLQPAFATVANVGSNSVYVAKVDSLGLELQYVSNGAGVSNLTVTLQRSLDGLVWETTPKFTWVVPFNGTTAAVAYTNLPNTVLGPAAYIRIYSISNSDSVFYATNVVCRAIRKTLKPSP